MNSYGSILAFYGDAESAKSAFDKLKKSGFRQIALLEAPSIDTAKEGKLSISRGQALAPKAAIVGAGIGMAAGRLLVPNGKLANYSPAIGAIVGGSITYGVVSLLEEALPEKLIERYRSSVMAGESLLIIRAPSNHLITAREILSADGTSGPATFFERGVPIVDDSLKAPLRRDVLPLESLRELATSLGKRHSEAKKLNKSSDFLLQRLRQNEKIIARVVRGLSQAARLEQAVSLSAEWLLDNNYVVQGQIKDVQRNLTRAFLKELPCITAGSHQDLPRIYLMASELISATDSRLDKEYLLDFIHHYQNGGTSLTTGELWALPLMIRIVLIENLRRLTAEADTRQRERERADFWANRLLAAAFREPDKILPLLAELSKEQKKIAPHFAERLVSHLFDEEAALGPVRSWLERKLAAPISEITSREQRRQAADSISVGNAITTLRFLSGLDWRDCFEQLSLVDAILSQDPAGVYRSMDFSTRDRYRKVIESLARKTEKSEVEVANLAVRTAAEDSMVRVRRAAPTHGETEHENLIYQATGHIGFYLIDEGQIDFENIIGYQPSRLNKVRRYVRDYPNYWYFPSIAVGTAGALWALGKIGQIFGGALPFPLRILSLLPASEIALQVINYGATRLIPPRALPKLEFKHGVPERWKTAVVIPMLLGSSEDAIENARQLELHYLANPDPNLRFALLADYTDASSKTLDVDAVKLLACQKAIIELNSKYGDIFALFIRERRWSETENRWMGWERKRGKIEEFNRYLRGYRTESPEVMHMSTGDLNQWNDISFVITLDADTQLPFGSALRMVETLAHPLNRPIIGKNGLVERGYSLVQPRVDTMLPSATATRFSRLFADASGLDPYTSVVSDVYQDVFGEGSYHGKGIYDLQAFDKVLDGRFPDATLLSHDLIEGAHVRVGLASDVILLDKFPPHYQAASKRDHRWIRGDWQILDWITPSVPTRNGRESNPLSLLNKWKVADNLRRSLIAPTSVVMLLGGWFLGGSAATAASLGVGGLLLWPTAINIFTRLTTSPDTLLRGRHEIGRGMIRAVIDTSLLLHRAGLCLDAIVRVLYRKYFSHKLFLEWQTAASTYSTAQDQASAFLMRLATGSALAGIIAVLLLSTKSIAIVAATPYLVAWAVAPLVVLWLSRDNLKIDKKELTSGDTKYLREIARETWRYFDDFVGPQTNWLPPDNYQESLNVEIAQRTSPTNMGLWLLAAVAANDFGWITLDEVASRTLSTLETLGELEKFEGHLFNWYSSLDTQPLRPRYVSTVDSGNLLGSLWTLARSVKDISRAPLFDEKSLDGIRDVLGILERSLGTEKSAFETELGEIRRLLDQRHETTISILEILRNLELPVASLSRTVSMRPLPRKTSQRSRSDLHSASTDPRFTITAPDYWAAQLETQLDLWIQSISRYGRWLEQLAIPADEFLISLGSDAPDLRRKILASPISITDLAKANVPELLDLIERRNQLNVAVEVKEWAQKLSDEWNRSRWLAGEMLANCGSVIDRARGLAEEMNMAFLFDSEKKLFSIGYNVDERRLDNSYYDLLASECRLASFCSVARGDVPSSHWLALGRRFGDTPVGPALMSWSGTMFEYLMPLLFQKAYENSLLERAVKVAVAAQIAYGARRGVPWGISEAAFSALDAGRTYQYKAFGTPSLGLKRGLEDDLVVAPYATLMALMVDPQAAMSNLHNLEKIGLRGDYGFYESIDFTRERLEEDSLVAAHEGETAKTGGRLATLGQSGAIVRCFMVHHQGMALLAMQNVLLDWPVQRRFHSDVFVQAAEPLLYERIPEAPPVLDDTASENVRPTRVDTLSTTSERSISPDTPAPRVHFLGSDRYNVAITAAGSGYSRWHDLEITRWRADTTRDNWGQFLYLRDLDTGVSWSATHQPLKRVARRSGVSFKSEKVEFYRRDSDIEARLEICVSPEDPCEVRRLSLVNYSNRVRKIEVTSFAELALAPHNADRAHPAFNKLFIQTAVIPEHDALLAWRRPRSNKETPVWAAHLVASHTHADDIQFETDRSKFLGRARDASNPAALETDLSGTQGAVLDPCFSIRRRLTLQPGERVQMAFVCGVADEESKILNLIERYGDFATCERAFDLAWTHSQLELHHLQIQADEAQSFQHLGGYLLYPHSTFRAPARRVRDNVKGQSGLWAYGISGDLPIMLVAIDNARDLAVVRQALRAHTFWRVRGFKCDLVIVNEQAGGYAQDLTETLKKLVDSSTPYTGTEKPGGVFLRTSETIPPEDMTLLLAVARVVLVAARGNIAQQIGAISDDIELPARFLPTSKEISDPNPPLPFMELPYFNGLGGFTQDGREYAIYLGPNARTPAPWINVFAHEHFGALTSESGNGFAWYGNSQSNRLLPWNNDPVSDTTSEAIYIRDEETGVFWTPTPLPIREQEAYRTRHGQGYTTFEHNSHGIEQELTTFVPMDGRNRPVRVQKLRLTNRSNRKRRLSATFYCEWLLGTTREEYQMQVVTMWDTETSTLMARNAYQPDFPTRIAFASATPRPTSHSASRDAFLGRNGHPQSPLAMKRNSLPETTGAGLDPCAVLKVPIELEIGEEITVSFLLGEAANVDEAKTIVSSFRDNSIIERSLSETKAWWDDMLSTLQVDVPDQSVNFLLNRWLPYQTLCCRIWARSAFYQSGGAWGFRDQLQDSLALTTLYPSAARQQILRSAAHQFEEGDVQHWWHPPGDAGVRTLITDDLLFLPYSVAQYVKVTGDLSILDEEVPFLHAPVLEEGEHEKYFHPEVSTEKATIFEHCRRAIEKGSTFGPNGLPLIGGGDWNDGLNRVGIEGKGESVWLAWFIIDVLRNFAHVAEKRNEKELAATYRERSNLYAQNIDANAWDGEYYRRGYFDDGTPLGSAQSEEAKIDSLPQSWASITGAGDPARAEQAMKSLETHLIKKDEKIVLLFTPAFDKTEKDPGYIKGYLPGVRENGGQYTHAACWVAYAYAKAGNGQKAVDTLRMLNPVEHARTPEDVATYKVEPYVVCADVYNLEGQVGRGGWTWYTGSCGWMYRAWVEGVLGFDKRGDILKISPAIPKNWKGFTMRYKHGSAVYEIEVVNNAATSSVELDGELISNGEIPLTDDGETHKVVISLKGESSLNGKALMPLKELKA
jgi:cyclic beta-1,2-glucan synthetase